MKKSLAVLFSLLMLVVLGVGTSRADPIEFTSTTVNTYPTPGPILVTGPTTQIPYSALGLVSGDVVNDFTWANESGQLYFSVAPGATGAPGSAVNTAGAGVAADIFARSGNSNLLAVPYSSLGLGASDTVNGLVMSGKSTTTGLYYALAAGSPSLIGPAATANIYTTVSGAPSVHLTAAQLGLKAGDQIEGLALLSNGTWALTLAPGSPTLADLGVTSSDILYDYANHSLPTIGIGYGSIGLLLADNVTALSFQVPEPSSAMLFCVGGLMILGMGGFRWWKQRG